MLSVRTGMHAQACALKCTPAGLPSFHPQNRDKYNLQRVAETSITSRGWQAHVAFELNHLARGTFVVGVQIWQVPDSSEDKVVVTKGTKPLPDTQVKLVPAASTEAQNDSSSGSS